jgi:hypothetical protein
VLNLFLTAFVLAFLGAGMRRPFLLVLAYTYIDIVAPQKVTWGFLAHIPISLIAFVCAFGAWMVAENKQGIRFSFRQFLLLLLLVYCGLTTAPPISRWKRRKSGTGCGRHWSSRCSCRSPCARACASRRWHW